MTGLVLHNFFRSSASVRLRVALNLKGLSYDYAAYRLRKNEHRQAEFLARNPQGLVPALELADGSVLTQSLAIMEYLDETHPQPPLLPADPLGRARVRALSQAIACDIHPINNLRVLNYLRTNFGADDETVNIGARHWVTETFGPLELMLTGDKRTGRFCHGDAPGMADLCLFAQMLNNKRFGVDMQPYPTIRRIYDACAVLPIFIAALPDKQPDAE